MLLLVLLVLLFIPTAPVSRGDREEATDWHVPCGLYDNSLMGCLPAHFLHRQHLCHHNILSSKSGIRQILEPEGNSGEEFESVDRNAVLWKSRNQQLAYELLSEK